MAAKSNEKYEDEVMSLKNILDREKLPLVLRTHNDYCHTFESHTVQVPKGTLLYIEGQTKIQVARISVLEHAIEDEERMTHLHGDDFIYERGNFVDREYLIPLKYPCKLKFIHRPGRRLRYATMQQVIGDMPHLLNVDVAVMDSPPHQQTSKQVPQHAILQLKTQFLHPDDDKVYITFTCDNETYTFCEDAVVNMTAVADTRVYTLNDLAVHQFFPAVFQFDSPALEDIVHYADDLSSNATLLAQGPLELLGRDHVIAAVAWSRDGAFRTYKTLLLVQDTWSRLLVQKMRFDSTEAKDSFIRLKFSQCPDAGFVERCLYCIPPDKSINVWLKSPDLFSVTPSGYTFKCRKEIDFHDSSDEEGPGNHHAETDDEDDGYYVMRPILPKRDPIRTKKLLNETISRKKTRFGKVHIELLDWFSKKLPGASAPNRCQPPPRPPKSSTVQRSRSAVQSSLHQSTFQTPPPDTPTNQKNYTPSYRRSVQRTSDSDSPHISREQKFSNNSSRQESVKRNTNCTPALRKEVSKTDRKARSEKIKCPRDKPADSKMFETGEYDDEYDTPADVEYMKHGHDSKQRPMEPVVPSAPGTHYIPEYTAADDENVYYTTGQVTRSSKTSHHAKKKEKPYVAVESRDGRGLMTPNQTPEDFYKLSVAQVSALFKLCNLGNVGDVCFEHRLDGSFFRQFDLSELQKEPFKLSSFQLMKVRQIICKGWRPKVND